MEVLDVPMSKNVGMRPRWLIFGVVVSAMFQFLDFQFLMLKRIKNDPKQSIE